MPRFFQRKTAGIGCKRNEFKLPTAAVSQQRKFSQTATGNEGLISGGVLLSEQSLPVLLDVSRIRRTLAAANLHLNNCSQNFTWLGGSG